MTNSTNSKSIIFIFIYSIFILFQFSCSPSNNSSDSGPDRFNLEKDLLLAQFDCKTDVDDLHSVAALATVLGSPTFKNIKYHAVAGSYGIQEGLYVPGNELFDSAFGPKWSDAHNNHDKALEEVKILVIGVIEEGGDVWIPEAGQSDFSANVVRNILSSNPQINTKERIHIVQHSDWNEEVTSIESLQFVKEYTDYNKIPDGNVVGNGTPGFRSEEVIDWQSKLEDPHLINIWNLAISLGKEYNGIDGRYNNTAVANSGLDFSDLSETCWILGMEEIVDAEEFFERFKRN